MQNSASMRPDLMLVTTQGIQGKKSHTNRQGNCRIVTQKGFNEPTNSILVDVYKGSGRNYEQCENAMINITFKSGKEFNGTFEQLEILITKK